MAQMPPPPPPLPEERPNRTGAIITLVGAAAIVIGSFLPWASARTIFGSLSKSGTEGDGVITLILGGVIGLLAGLELGNRSNTRRVVLILAIITLGLGIFEFVDVSRVAQEASSEYAQMSVGVGIWAILGGAGLALFGSLQNR